VGSIRAMIRARYVSPTKAPSGSLRFSFQDLVLLRTARQLRAARISRRQVGDALRTIQAQLPSDLPPSGLSVAAVGGRVVVHETGKARDALSGQLLLAFELRIVDGSFQFIDTAPEPRTDDAAGECDRHFTAALELEGTDIDAAMAAYRACVSRHADIAACANLGRLLHLQGRISEAVELYQKVEHPDSHLLYNLAVALEDLGRVDEAIACYNRVLEQDTDYADAHHNIARLWHLAGDKRRAVRHWSAFRKLDAKGSTDRD
jgi:Tetratricopeptide repeat